MRLNYLSIHKLQWLHYWSSGMDNHIHPTIYWARDYLLIEGLNLNHVSKGAP